MPDSSARTASWRGRGSRPVEVVAGQPRVDERGQQLGPVHRVALRGLQAAAQQRGRHLGTVLGDAQERQRAQRGRALLAPVEQLGGFGQPALPDAQLRHRGGGGLAHLRDVAAVGVQRGLERLLGLGPAPGRHQHVGVHRPARAEERSRRVRAREFVDVLAPFGRAVPVARVRARHDEVAVGLGERVDVAHPPGGRGRHRLLEQRHPGLDAPGAHLRAPEEAEGEDLEIIRAARARDLHPAPSVRDLLVDVAGVARALDRDPAMSRARAGVLERALGPGQPAARRRRAPGDAVLMGHPHPDPRRVVAAPGLDVPLERPLPLGDAAGDIAEKPQREAEPLARRGNVAALEHALERAARALPVRPLERLDARRQIVVAVSVHARRSIQIVRATGNRCGQAPQPTSSPTSSLRQNDTAGGAVTPAACMTGPISGPASSKNA